MILESCYLSLSEMRRVRPSASKVVISILDTEEHPQRPLLNGFRSVLSLEFEDTSEERNEHWLLWPDTLSPDEHTLHCSSSVNRAPEIADAQKILAFLAEHHRSPERVSLITHCHAGISRSSAVAWWASKELGVPLNAPHGRGIEGANRRLLRLLDKAAGRQFAKDLVLDIE